jgi:hypothetical protein
MKDYKHLDLQQCCIEFFPSPDVKSDRQCGWLVRHQP